MKTKLLLITFLLFNIPANTTSQYPSYEWNTTELGVSIGDVFEFKLSEYSIYNGENDTTINGDIFLNSTSILAREKATDDEFLNVSDTFSITIQSNAYFQSDQEFPAIYFEENDAWYVLLIPQIKVTLTHNSFVAERTMELSINPSRTLSIFSTLFEPLFLTLDWETYELIYSEYEYSNETIIDENNFYITKSTRNFDVGENKVQYNENQFKNISDSKRPWMSSYENLSTNAIIDKNSGLIEKLDIQIQTRHASPSIDRRRITIENINEVDDEATNIFSLGQENNVFFSLTSFAILIVLLLDNRGKRKI
ncbi:MAG: hypothetical protein HeimC2_12570 [Candidatus Heimdallarchaeota archaeon LC_2]|nr:MAG: hypothetical protein HeimC2_12570 [Candidatus Heimdallarchaeota archaeon LC_2]